MNVGSFFSKIRKFDVYPKTQEDFRIRTYGGAIISIVSGVIMTILFISELSYYLSTDIDTTLLVDTSRGLKMKINFNVTFPRLACSGMSVDAIDVSGEQHLDVEHTIYKRRLDPNGNQMGDDAIHVLGSTPAVSDNALVKTLDPKRCESCYGAETEDRKCCNTCEDVKDSYRKKGWALRDPASVEQCKREGIDSVEKLKPLPNEGCLVYGHIEVNRVAGNFHFAPGHSSQQSHAHVHDIQGLSMGAIDPTDPLKSVDNFLKSFNMTHDIHQVSFGEPVPGVVNPLDGVSQLDDKGALMCKYYIKIVPTVYQKLNDLVTYTNQYSVTVHKTWLSFGGHGESGLPGVFFVYEISPMMVKYTETRRSFMHFLTGVCAIVGGVFTVAGLIDSFVYHSGRALQQKMQLGKAF